MASEIFLVCTTLQHHNSKGNSSKTQTLQLLNHQTLKPSNPPTLKLSHHNPFKPFWSLALWRASHAASHFCQPSRHSPDRRPRHCRWSGTPGEIRGQVWDLAICNHCNAQFLWMSIAKRASDVASFSKTPRCISMRTWRMNASILSLQYRFRPSSPTLCAGSMPR